jgi:hypothetical protein
LQLSLAMRNEFWPARDWQAQFRGLEARVRQFVNPTEQSRMAFQLAEVAEFLVPDRQSAVDLYTLCWKAQGKNHRALVRMRFLCRELLLLDAVAKIAELEFRETNNPECQIIAGQAWLDAGAPDRALKPLLGAIKRLPDDPAVKMALAMARREWPNVRAEAVRLRQVAERAEPTQAAALFLQAARIYRMLGTDPGDYEAMLRGAVGAVPRNDSANALLERWLIDGQRWDELVSLAERRVAVALSPYEEIDVYRRFGMLLADRCGQGGLGAGLLMSALATAYDRGVAEIPGHLAMLALLRDHFLTTGDTNEIFHFCQRALANELGDDERLAIAVFAAAQAQRSGGVDLAVNRRFVAVVRELVEDHEALAEWRLGDEVSAAAAAQVAAEAEAEAAREIAAARVAAEGEREDGAAWPAAAGPTLPGGAPLPRVPPRGDPDASARDGVRRRTEAAMHELAALAQAMGQSVAPAAATTLAEELAALDDEPAERRVAPRIAATARVEVKFSAAVKVELAEQDGAVTEFSAFTRDLSDVGAFVESDRTVPASARGRLTLHLPGEDEWSVDSHEIEIWVARVEPGAGFGAEFIEPGEDLRRAISALCDKR